MVYTYNDILFIFRFKKGNLAICNIDKPEGHYAKKNKPIGERHILHDSTYMQCLKQTHRSREQKGVDARGWHGGVGGELFNGYKVSVKQDE